jgi:hypothetical protein
MGVSVFLFSVLSTAVFIQPCRSTGIVTGVPPYPLIHYLQFQLSAVNHGLKKNWNINPLNAELNPICHLLALLGGATRVDVSRLRIKEINGS